MSFTTPGNRIYHYCKLNTGIEKILTDKRLLLSPIIKTNDPRENKSIDFSAILPNISEVIDIDKKNQEISKILRADCKMISFAEDFKKNYWGFESSRMWAYYGDNHKGLCIELGKKEFLEENKNIINPKLFRKVAYFPFNIKKPIEERYVDHIKMEEMGAEKYLHNVFRKKHLKYLYFTKNKEWESENESRLIHFSNKIEDEYCSIANSIRNIYVGVDFHKSYLPAITNLQYEIDVYQLEYSKVKLVPKRIHIGTKSNL